MKRNDHPRKPLCEPLEHRLLCKITMNGEFAITPPSNGAGGGQAHETIKLHPAQGVVGLNTAEANSNGVVTWQKTGEHERTPGDQSGPHQFST